MNHTEVLRDLGKWVGRSPAFGLIASKFTAADAECLKRIHAAEAYKILGLTWEEFCREHVGVSRVTAEKAIHHLEEFGEVYFRLSQIVRISPEAYRALAGSVKDNDLELAGERIPIVKENAARILAAVEALRGERQQTALQLAALRTDVKAAREKLAARSPSRLGERLRRVLAHIEACLAQAERLVAGGIVPRSDRDRLAHAIKRVGATLRKLAA